MKVLIENGEVRNPNNYHLIGYTFEVDKVRYWIPITQIKNET